jgi:hypothetical protein
MGSNPNFTSNRAEIGHLKKRIAALEAELAAVKEENAELTKRLSSGVKFYTLSVGGASGIEICKIHAGWSVYITHYGNFGPKNERTGLFESLDAAWDALVVAGWLA